MRSRFSRVRRAARVPLIVVAVVLVTGGSAPAAMTGAGGGTVYGVAGLVVAPGEPGGAAGAARGPVAACVVAEPYTPGRVYTGVGPSGDGVLAPDDDLLDPKGASVTTCRATLPPVVPMPAVQGATR